MHSAPESIFATEIDDVLTRELEELQDLYNSLISLPDDEDLLDLIQAYPVESQQLAVGTVEVATVSGLPNNVLDAWTFRPNLKAGNTLSIDFKGGINQIQNGNPAFLLCLTDCSSGIEVAIRKAGASLSDGFALFNSEGHYLSAVTPMDVLRTLASIAAQELPDTIVTSHITEKEFWAGAKFLLQAAGLKHGLLQDENRLSAELTSSGLPEEQAATVHGEIAIVTTETVDSSFLSTVVERQLAYPDLDASVTYRIEGEYYGVRSPGMPSEPQRETPELPHAFKTISFLSDMSYVVRHMKLVREVSPNCSSREVELTPELVTLMTNTVQELVASICDYIVPNKF